MQKLNQLQTNLVAGIAFLLVLLCLWAPVAATSGMGWETYYTVASESSRSWSNFLYTPDPLRIHASNFYELAYRLGEMLGIRGSFLSYQLVYAALWWARSFLGFLIIRQLLPDSFVLPFIIGAIMLVHAPDVLLGWLGQLHQFGYFLWLLTALYLLIKALQAPSHTRAILYTAAACLFEYLCLWTYEGPLFIIVGAPFVFAFLVRPARLRTALSWLFWYIPPAVYSYLTYQRYLHLGGSAYQQSLMRKSFEASAILSDWFYNVTLSLSFWSWLHIESHLSESQVLIPMTGVIAAFAAGGWLLARREAAGLTQPFRLRQVWLLMAGAFILLWLSFPAQILLAAARQPRRTQLLSAIAASMVLGAAIVVIAEILPQRRLRSIFAIALTIPIMCLGARRTIEREGSHRWEWSLHLPAMKQLLRRVPRVTDGTIVVMTNVPKAADPFYSYAFWFNNALRLAYPRTAVAGVYYYDDNTAGPADNLRLEGKRWEFTGESVAPLIRSGGIEQTLVLEYDGAGHAAKVLPEIPSFVCGGRCESLLYTPNKRVLTGAPAPEALRRYGPL